MRVEIFDQSYSLRGTDPDYIQKLASFVDSKMRAVSSQTSTIDSLRLAVLAALNIADEYHVLKRKYDVIASEINSRRSHFRRTRRSAPGRCAQSRIEFSPEH